MNKIIRIACISIIFSMAAGGVSAATDIRWFFAVEGLQEIQGSTIVKTGMGSNYRYSAGSLNATVSLSMPAKALMIKYREPDVTCGGSGNTDVEVVNDRAVFSGLVRCFKPGAGPADAEEHPIEGWFELDN